MRESWLACEHQLKQPSKAYLYLYAMSMLITGDSSHCSFASTSSGYLYGVVAGKVVLGMKHPFSALQAVENSASVPLLLFWLLIIVFGGSCIGCCSSQSILCFLS